MYIIVCARSIEINYVYTIPGLGAQVYQWRCSELDEDNNCFSLPDIPIADIDDVLAEADNLRVSSGNEIYILH